MFNPHGITRRLALRRVASTTAALLVLLTALTTAPAALAGKPKGEFAVFADCPLGTTGVNQCVYAQFTGGELRLGKLDVPIKRTITLQGGLIVTEKGETFANVTEGQTLSKTEEEVPGGLLGIIGPEGSSLGLTLELVGSVALNRAKLAAGEGTALTLPVKAHFKNVYLGEECVLGSSAKPITLNLTTGTTNPLSPNKPIKGSPGERESKDEGNLVIYKGDSLLENNFSVPGAEGCGPISERSFIDALINEKYGYPASDGNNTAILTGTSEFASAEAVRKSE
jgi:hypothetical protein